MTRISIFILFALVSLGIAGCGDNPRGKSHLPPNAKPDIGQPKAIGGDSKNAKT